MTIKNLFLNNYRNYISETFEYSEGLNIVCGSNAQGKTNSAEAIFMLCTGYSPRVKRDKQVIRYGEETAEIKAQAKSTYGEVSVDMRFYQSSKKRIEINGVAISKIGELLGNINSIFFNPSELKLVQESPEDRRRFMDISLSQLNKRYFYALKNYNNVLAHRNSLLKEKDKNLIYDTIRLWDVQLIENAIEIIRARNDFLKELAPFASNAHKVIADQDNLLVEPSKIYGDSIEEIKSNLETSLNEKLEKDIILGYTSVGPHRDDIKLTLGEEDVKTFCSQGQQRTVALALKLAELEIFKKRIGEYPLLILDDALSELDVSRQKRLIKAIEGVQTIITCTKIDVEVFEGFNYKKINVDGGRIV